MKAVLLEPIIVPHLKYVCPYPSLELFGLSSQLLNIWVFLLLQPISYHWSGVCGFFGPASTFGAPPIFARIKNDYGSFGLLLVAQSTSSATFNRKTISQAWCMMKLFVWGFFACAILTRSAETSAFAHSAPNFPIPVAAGTASFPSLSSS